MALTNINEIHSDIVVVRKQLKFFMDKWELDLSKHQTNQIKSSHTRLQRLERHIIKKQQKENEPCKK